MYAKQLQEAHFCAVWKCDPCSCLAKVCAVIMHRVAAGSKIIAAGSADEPTTPCMLIAASPKMYAILEAGQEFRDHRSKAIMFIVFGEADLRRRHNSANARFAECIIS